MTDLTQRLKACYTGAVFDVLREIGQANCVLPRTIRAIDPDTHLAGRVWTMRGRPDDTVSRHESLLSWVNFLSVAPSGHVVICQPQDDQRALMGELSAEALQSRGVLGYIVDGGSRDNAFVRKIGFAVFSRFQSPRDVVASWVPEGFGEPISIGGVLIRTGDWVLADIDGIVIIPATLAEDVVTKVEAVMAAENLVRRAILDGVSPTDAYLQYGKF